MEKEILSRLDALRRYLRTPARDPHLSMEEIFRKGKTRRLKSFKPIIEYVKRQKKRLGKDTARS